MASRTKNAPISACVSRSPSTSAWTSAVIRSSAGSRSRNAASSVANCVSVQTVSPSTTIGSRPARTSGSAIETSVSAARTIRSRSASGMPIMSEMVMSGRRRETMSTKSPPPAGAASSTIWRARARMPSSIRRTWRGVNAEETRPRSFVWRGASIARNDWVASRISGGELKKSTPRPEQNVAGSREIRRTSS
jgi:hypothetical protein